VKRLIISFNMKGSEFYQKTCVVFHLVPESVSNKIHSDRCRKSKQSVLTVLRLVWTVLLIFSFLFQLGFGCGGWRWGGWQFISKYWRKWAEKEEEKDGEKAWRFCEGFGDKGDGEARADAQRVGGNHRKQGKGKD